MVRTLGKKKLHGGSRRQRPRLGESPLDKKEPVEYESPVIVDYGDVAELTQHQLHGEHDEFPFHGHDPHMTFSAG